MAVTVEPAWATKNLGDAGDTVGGNRSSPQNSLNADAEITNEVNSGWAAANAQRWNQITGGMSMSQFQALPQAQQSAIEQQANNEMDAAAYPTSLADKIMGGIALTASLGAVGLAAGPIAGAVGAGVDNAVGVGGSLAGTVAGDAAVGGVVGTAGSALTGQNIGKGALLGALGGGIGGGISQGLTGAGVSPGIAGVGGKIGSNLTTSAVGNALSGGGNTNMATSGTTQMNSNVLGSLFGGGAATSGGGSGSSSLLGGLAGLGGLVAGGISNNNIGSMQTNAYTTAGNAANSGNQWGVNGIGGVGASFNNGQLGVNGGAFSPLSTGYSQFGASQLGMANQFGSGGVPSSVTQGFNNYNTALGGAQAYAGQGQNSGASMMNAGQNLFNSAGTNYNSAYSTALNSGLAALNPAIQQQSNALLNSNFERGQAGTSGGALQTQALQNSFNTADLQVQNNAVNQGLAAMNTTGNLGLGAYSQGSNQLGAFNNQSASLGAQGLQAGENYSAFSPQLAGLYGQNANQSVAGASGINSMGLQNAQLGLQSQTNVGNQMNNAARTQVLGANTYNGGTSGYLASILGGLSGQNGGGAAGSVLNSLSSMFGGGSTNVSAGNNQVSSGLDSFNSGTDLSQYEINPISGFGSSGSYFGNPV